MRTFHAFVIALPDVLRGGLAEDQPYQGSLHCDRDGQHEQHMRQDPPFASMNRLRFEILTMY